MNKNNVYKSIIFLSVPKHILCLLPSGSFTDYFQMYILGKCYILLYCIKSTAF